MAIRFNNWVFSPRLIPSVAFVLLMILLLSLGNWQLGRSVEKQALIHDRVAQSEASELVLSSKLVDVRSSVSVRHASKVTLTKVVSGYWITGYVMVSLVTMSSPFLMR